MTSLELQASSSRPVEQPVEESPNSKADINLVESAGAGHAASYEESVAARLPKAHRDYLLQRHGTLELDPIPSMGPADPYNWPEWKKMINLILVAFHACMGTFTAAAIIPAYSTIAEDLGISLQEASYLTSLQIAILGGAPLFWKPLSNRFGRRPIFLLSLICSLVCNIGCAKSTTYASVAACRALVAFFISPASAIGSAVVMETTFKKDRARYMGVWTLMITLGVPIGPFIFGFVTYRVGYHWIYWILAMINGGQFILYLFFGPETRYLGGGVDRPDPNWKTEYLSIRRIDPTPLTWYEFIRPFTMARHPSILIPACAYAMVFLFGSILATVEVPQLLQEKFGLNAEQLGLQFLGVIIGSLIGEQMGGALSDFWMNRRARRLNRKPEPEFRLWLSYFGFGLTIIGMIVFLVCTQESKSGHWNVSPIIGTAIGAVGNQLVTTVMITYAVDCFPQEAASIGVFITFVRQIWGFLGPFWFSPMFETVGIAPSAGIGSALVVAVSVIPTIALHWRGQVWRRKDEE
ncbi:Major facilitator superfamily domain general substrate transporter [Penicillium macrosclerotiorum]|uniref:Major facilitator superfamily domain general substrate transporter n=1 Tax=Penicillium macrosclerotiorum TaxID=303699 RepID=UPI002548E5EE|nr:Major facilitator superfamily domain general substrate transporter [Penicillium macrosclerotiorum]KAJ5676095.1 Major facilitator superfamily domain general substrate transporter [Penicillium macrosclerotiorum]